MADALLYAGAAAAFGGMALLRYAWSRPKRSLRLNAIAWMLLASAMVVGAAMEGMWGVAIEFLVGMATAFAILIHAVWAAPASKVKPSNRRANMLPEPGQPLRLGRRVLTFLIVVALGMLAAVGYAMGARWLAELAGAGEADANVTALFVMPLAWTFVAFFMMMSGRRRQLTLVAIGLASAVPAVVQRAIA
jgi:uncharacterized membrane protein